MRARPRVSMTRLKPPAHLSTPTSRRTSAAGCWRFSCSAMRLYDLKLCAVKVSRLYLWQEGCRREFGHSKSEQKHAKGKATQCVLWTYIAHTATANEFVYVCLNLHLINLSSNVLNVYYVFMSVSSVTFYIHTPMHIYVYACI